MDAKECCCDVVIIGCGIAGLSAGTRLLELDPSCRIAFIEARDRVGGRTETQHVKIPSPDEEDADAASYPVDVGGQWLGSAHKEMISLVSGLGIELIEQQYPDPPIPTTRRTTPGCCHLQLRPMY